MLRTRSERLGAPGSVDFGPSENLEESFRLARRLRPRLHIAVLIVDGSGFVACRFWFALLASKSKR